MYIAHCSYFKNPANKEKSFCDRTCSIPEWASYIHVVEIFCELKYVIIMLQDLERKAAELQRKEQELQRMQFGGKVTIFNLTVSQTNLFD